MTEAITEPRPNLAQRLLEVNRKLGWIVKGGVAPKEQGGYRFATISDILDQVRDELNANGVVFSHSTTEQTITRIDRDGRNPQWLHEVQGDYAYINADDPHDVIAGRWAGSALDVSDKGTWKAITGGLKYILIPNHLLPTGDDPEATNPEVGGDADRPAPRPVNADRPQAPAPPVAQKPDVLTPAQIVKLKASLSDKGLTKEQSQAVVLKVTGQHSSKTVTSRGMDDVLTFISSPDGEEYLVGLISSGA